MGPSHVMVGVVEREQNPVQSGSARACVGMPRPLAGKADCATASLGRHCSPDWGSLS